MFRFQRFTVNDDRCAMKVGTDGVLLGAWAQLNPTGRVIDVGTGCGLIALFLSQRFPHQTIEAWEIDAAAAQQAQENIEASPFLSRISLVAKDFLACDYPVGSVDAIVSNPPFFQETLRSPDEQRATARHCAAGLTFASLITQSSRLLTDFGSLQVILPKDAQALFHQLCDQQHLHLVRQTDIRTVERKSPKRVLLHFTKETPLTVPLRTEIVLIRDGERSEEYQTLCQDFYL